MRVADYIAEAIVGVGVDHVFLVVGGGAMYLDDALGLKSDLELVFCHHEQACAMAAEGYARVRGGLGVVCVTSGPGGTNTITGVLGQWHDSVPVLYISGQVKRETTVAATRLPLRQLGDQEADIVRLVAPITKYAVSVVDPRAIRFHLEKAVWLATHGRPGPVWVDVPLDVQAAEVEPDELAPFVIDGWLRSGDGETDTAEEAARRDAAAEDAALPSWPAVASARQAPGALAGVYDRAAARVAAGEVVRRLERSERPVILAGSAVRSSGALAGFRHVIDQLRIPVCLAWNAGDLLPDDHPQFIGRPGTVGDRAGNFALQNSDFVLVLGCRLNIRQIGYEFRAFAHHAYRVHVDVDEAELAKPTVFPDMSVHADVATFLRDMRSELEAARPTRRREEWLAWCRGLKRRYPVSPEQWNEGGPVDPYVFIRLLCRHLRDGDIVVCANGTACVVTIQAFSFREGQRLLVNSGTAGMGYDLPAAVGAAFGAVRGSSTDAVPQPARVVCLAGDGSIQMNLQELQTIRQHGLCVKILVFDNDGYASIRQTQDNLLAGRRVGEGPASGVTLPDMVAIAGAYGIPARRVTRHDELDVVLAETLAGDGPALVDVVMDAGRAFTPRVIAQRRSDGVLVSRPLEDMYPFLEREEFNANMIGPHYISGKG